MIGNERQTSTLSLKRFGVLTRELTALPSIIFSEMSAEQRILKGGNCVPVSRGRVCVLSSAIKMMSSSQAKGQVHYKRFMYPKNHPLWTEKHISSSAIQPLENQLY